MGTKKQRQDVAALLMPTGGCPPDSIDVESLSALAKERTQRLDVALEAVDVAQSDAVDFASLEELQEAVDCFSAHSAVLAARFGTSPHVAKSLIQLGDVGPASKRSRKDTEADLRVDDVGRGLFTVGDPGSGSGFRLAIHQCSGKDLIDTMETARQSTLAGRAQAVAADLVKRGRLSEAHGRWDIAVFLVDQAEHRLREAVKRPGNRLGGDPYLFFALVHVQLLMQGVAVKLARTREDSDTFVEALLSMLRERVCKATAR